MGPWHVANTINVTPTDGSLNDKVWAHGELLNKYFDVRMCGRGVAPVRELLRSGLLRMPGGRLVQVPRVRDAELAGAWAEHV